MKIAAIQLTSTSTIEDNFEIVELILKRAQAESVDLVLLPEMFAVFGNAAHLALQAKEQVGTGPIQDFLARVANQYQVWLVAGTIPLSSAEDAARYHAACLVYEPSGKCVARYDKIHLFDVNLQLAAGKKERHAESKTVIPGKQPQMVTTPWGVLGLSVCYDLRFPELYRHYAGVDLLLMTVPSAFTVKTGQAHWQTLLCARAIENQCYVLAANQFGEHEGGRQTYGHSMIVDPWGEVIACIAEGTGLITAEVDTEKLASIRQQLPVLEHRVL